MGCDIHVYTEFKKENKTWVNVDKIIKNIYFNGEWLFEDEYCIIPIYDYRNYELFEVLAGVRGNMDDAIHYPKGIPDDISKLTQDQYKHWSLIAHSQSYFTLYELKRNRYKVKKEVIKNYDDLITSLEQRLCEIYNYDSVKSIMIDKTHMIRIVFWFDN